ncbi:MAG TPA: metalloregulator ArsR/SmtB family transcription factor [Chloroflexota bacterium]|nr:metalloregulator ArsR/SmtB family transcription factor [Chloroflexota bacterium]
MTVVESPRAVAPSFEILGSLFRGLADPARLSCLLAVRARPRTVGDVVAVTGLSQPNVSKHLACLRGCGLVEAERSGRFVTYRIAGPRVEQVVAAAERLLQEAAQPGGTCPYCGSRVVGPAAIRLGAEELWSPQ